jgi:hypothetical protein
VTFIPNRVGHIRRKSKTSDVFGQPNYGKKEAMRFALVRFDTNTEDSTVRADSSATRGNIKEFHSTGRILTVVATLPKWGDLIIFDGKVFRIREVEPRYNVQGKLDHYEIDFEKSEDRFGDET